MTSVNTNLSMSCNNWVAITCKIGSFAALNVFEGKYYTRSVPPGSFPHFVFPFTFIKSIHLGLLCPKQNTKLNLCPPLFLDHRCCFTKQQICFPFCICIVRALIFAKLAVQQSSGFVSYVFRRAFSAQRLVFAKNLADYKALDCKIVINK